MALSTLAKGIGLLLLFALLALLWMNFLRVSNLEDEVRVLQVELQDMKQGVTPHTSVTAFDVQTPLLAGDPERGEVVIALAGAGSAQRGEAALTEVLPAEGPPRPLVADPVVLLPNVAVELPLPPEAGCFPLPGRRPTWILILDGVSLRLSSRDCVYQQPVRGRLRGTITR